MRSPHIGLAVVVACGWAWAGCGGKVIGEGTSGSSGASAPPTSTITFPSPGNETPPPTTAGPTPTTPPDSAKYSAQAWPGGLDHIDVFKADFATDTCVHIHLAAPSGPGTGPFGAIAAPAPWSVRSADRSETAKDCRPQVRRGAITPAQDGKGRVSWPPTSGKVFPCWMDLDVTLVFPDGTTETMARDALEVIGGC